MADDFERWMRETFRKVEPVNGEPLFSTGHGAFFPLSQLPSLILHLSRLSGCTVEGVLSAERLEERRKWFGQIGCVTSCPHNSAHMGTELIAHIDALAAALAHAHAERDQLRLLITDLTHPAGDGQEAQARAYREGVKEERARVLRVLRDRAETGRAVADTMPPGTLARVAPLASADALDAAAIAVEKGE